MQSTSPRGLTIAIDLGTTTIAAQLIAPAGGVLAVETALNPQAAFGSDVMSRIRAALDGHDFTDIDLTTPFAPFLADSSRASPPAAAIK